METFVIKNQNQILKINQLGAEISSWLINGEEMIYQKSGQWKKQAPILFPFVGDHIDKTVKLNNKIVKFQRHGYCRDQLFKVINQKENEITFELDISRIEKNYQLKLKVIYTLKQNVLQIKWEVINFSDYDSCFQLGWHPGFNLKNNKYNLLVENFYSFKLDENNFLLNEKIKLNSDLLQNFKTQDSLIIPTNKIEINSKNQNISIISDFAYGVIWKMKEENFICLETWTSPCCKKNESNSLQKRNNVKIKSKESKNFFIEVKIW